MQNRQRVAVVRAVRAVIALSLSSRVLTAQLPARDDRASAPLRTLVGRVVDGASRGIAGADVHLVGGPGTLTDSAGRFALRALPTSAMWLVVRKVGYDSVSRSIDAGRGSTADTITITLARIHRLDEIVVEDRVYDRALWDRGFYHRQKVASGFFFDPDAISHFGGDGLGSLVKQVPRVEVRRINNEDHAFSSVAGRACRMNIYVDGMFQRVAMPSPQGEEGLGLSQLIDPRDIAAVEVYPRATSVPTQFQRMGPPAGPQGISSAQIGSPSGYSSRSLPQGENADAACGTIVIWTRVPSASPATGNQPR